jgi:glycosyltransferase involved in cell wall biosynthesis
MKIALVTDGLAAGGAERQCVLAASVLIANGQEAEIICYHDINDFETELISNKIPIRIILSSAGRMSIVWKMAMYFRQNRFDVVHAFKGTSSIYGRAAAHLARVPKIFGGYRAQIPQDRWSAFCNCWLSRNTSGWIVNSESIKRRLPNLFSIPESRVFVVRNAIDPNKFLSPFTKEHARVKLGLDPKHSVVTMIANFRPMKNHDMFFRVARALENRFPGPVNFLLAGHGPLESKIRKQCQEWQSNFPIKMLGYCRDIAGLLKASSVIILTSHANSEGLPNVLIEAGAAVRPSVSTNCGAAEVIEDGITGFIVPSDDDETMALKISVLLKDPMLMNKMGKAARKKIENSFSPHALYRNLMTVYRRAV